MSNSASAGASGLRFFELVEPPVLSRFTVDRCEELRLDSARQVESWPKARMLVVDERGRAPMRQTRGGEWEMLTKPATDFGPSPSKDAALLGEQDGIAYWTVRGRPSLIDGDDPSQWFDLRTKGGVLDSTGAGLFTTAVAVLGWHDAGGFCANCGSTTERRNAGWATHCPSCGREEYPRTDPAVICLVHDGGTGGSAKVLLARQPIWPPGRYSVLAGFVEAGESLEACVLREIEEEVGLVVSDVRYLASQAWPFPRSLMIGFSAIGDPSVTLRPAEGEISEAFWVTRDELREGLVDNDWESPGDPTGKLMLPPSISIARSMLDAWAALD